MVQVPFGWKKTNAAVAYDYAGGNDGSQRLTIKRAA